MLHELMMISTGSVHARAGWVAHRKAAADPMRSRIMSVYTHRFEVMSTFGEIHVRADDDAARNACTEAVEQLEAWSAEMTRFDPASPLEQLNDAGGGTVSADVHDVLVAAHRAWRATGGRFDIGVGADLIAAGYDRDFDELAQPSSTALDAAVRISAAQSHAVSWLDAPEQREAPFELVGEREVVIRDGIRLDLGGIAKGWAADRTRETLSRLGSCLVNLGGDISVHVADGDPAWPVGIQLADAPAFFDVAVGGVATSGQDVRVWAGDDDAVVHHIIDPRTGRPAASDLLRVTIFGASCCEAETWTKALMMSTRVAAEAEANRLGLNAILVGMDGVVVYAGGLAALNA